MINIKYTILNLSSFLNDCKTNKLLGDDLILELTELINSLSDYHGNLDKNTRMQSLIQADQLNQTLLLKLNKQASSKGKINKLLSLSLKSKVSTIDQLLLTLEKLVEYFDSKIAKHQKIKKILSTISIKEILLLNLRAKKDYGSQEDLGLGQEPYLPSKNNLIRINKQSLITDSFDKVMNGLDDRRVLDGRGSAPTLRHQIEKYDPLHRPWRNFLYREYNDTFDFWKSAKNVELHLIYPEPSNNQTEQYNEIVQKWINKVHTYTKDLMIIFDNTTKSWKAFVRDERKQDKYSEIVIDDKSPLMPELNKITNKNSRDYDRSILEDIIVKTQAFATDKKPRDAIYFYRDNANFYSWVEHNTKLKTTGTVVYFNELQRTKYLVRPNEESQLRYIQTGELVETKEDHGRKPESYIYALDLAGNLYIAKEGPFTDNPNVRIQHPSFTSGARLLAAGTIKVKYGKITYIDNGSGHYMVGEFSLMKAVLEFKKNKLLAEDCVVDFVTMNRSDERYASENKNQNSVARFLEISGQALLNVTSISKESNAKTEEGSTVKISTSPNFQKKPIDFELIWNQTDLSKTNLCVDRNSTALCDFFLDEVNQLIIKIGKDAAAKQNSTASSEYHAIRATWTNILNNMLKGATNEGIIPAEHVTATFNKYLPQLTKINSAEQFTNLLGSISTQILEAKNVNCFFSKDRVMHDCTAYTLQSKVATAKKQQKDMGVEEIRKLSSYKLFLLTSKVKNSCHMTPGELDQVESQNLKGLTN